MFVFSSFLSCEHGNSQQPFHTWEWCTFHAELFILKLSIQTGGLNRTMTLAKEREMCFVKAFCAILHKSLISYRNGIKGEWPRRSRRGHHKTEIESAESETSASLKSRKFVCIFGYYKKRGKRNIRHSPEVLLLVGASTLCLHRGPHNSTSGPDLRPHLL